MRLLAWVFRILLFVVLLGFAMTNTAPTELRFFGTDIVWRAPLVLFLLVFFAAGALLGALSAVPALFRHRREIARLRRELSDTREARRDTSIEPAVPPPLP